MSEPIYVDFQRKQRVQAAELKARRLQRAATQVRLFLDQMTRQPTACDMVLPDPIRNRDPYLQVYLPLSERELEQVLRVGWPEISIDVSLFDPPGAVH
jgi:hypothetical protein